MVAYFTRMPAGVAGDVNRLWEATIEPAVVTPSGVTGAPLLYGIPLFADQVVESGNIAGNMRALVQGIDTTDTVYGILIRPFPTQSSVWPNDPSATGGFPPGGSVPPTSGPVDVLRSGYVTVLLSGSQAAVKGGAVNIWYAAASGTHIVGGFEAHAAGGSTFTLANSTFMGPADANGFVEIAFRLGGAGYISL